MRKKKKERNGKKKGKIAKEEKNGCTEAYSRGIFVLVEETFIEVYLSGSTLVYLHVLITVE